MLTEKTEINVDVLIIGAGPAGSTCALALRDAGVSVALIDKATFPRDKVCGDAIPGRAIKTLKNVEPEFEKLFKNFDRKCETRSTKLFYNGRTITFNWVREAYTCSRMDFDHFLYSLVSSRTNTKIFTGAVAEGFKRNDNGFSVSIKNSRAIFNTRILIAADGAQSVISRQLTGKILDRHHHVGSVRAYYTNVHNIKNDTTEIYFDRKFLPSYLWVFPLPEKVVNVGFGMLSSEIAKRKLNLKKIFYDFIESTPALKQNFKDAVQVSSLDGFGLPLGSKTGVVSGDSFMLTGDAASLIDPISGDGIGNAMLSGALAAEQAMICFSKNEFSEKFMHQYDQRLFSALSGELKTHYRAQRMLSKFPFLLDILFIACQNQKLNELARKRL